MRMRKEDYLTEATKQLEIELKNNIKEDREKALAQKCIDKIPQERKKYVFDILSKEFAAK